MSAIAEWNKQVERHHAQSITAENEKKSFEKEQPEGDFWRPFAGFFKDDPKRTGDDVLMHLMKVIGSGKTVLDVGGGAGRFALPLALCSSSVTVVEPSDSMIEGLREVAAETGIENVSVVQSDWEDAKVEPADFVLCSHVVYGVNDIEPFLKKLTESAIKKVLILTFTHSPISRFSPFWKPVHEEDRINLPGMIEMLPALWEMNIYPDVHMFPLGKSRGFDDKEKALDALRSRIYVAPDSPKDERLKAAIDDLLIETEEGFTIKGVEPTGLALVSWPGLG